MTNRFIIKHDILNLKKVYEDEIKICFIYTYFKKVCKVLIWSHSAV